MTDRITAQAASGALFAVAGALITSFLGLATASASTAISAAFFVASTAAGITAARRTSVELAGPDRLGAIGANLATTGATIFGASAVQSVGPDWPGLSIVVAPICGLSAVWWFAHARYRDNLRWLVAMIGSGFGAFFGFASIAIALLNERPEVNAIHRAGFVIAAAALFAAAFATIAGAIGFIRSARSG